MCLLSGVFLTRNNNIAIVADEADALCLFRSSTEPIEPSSPVSTLDDSDHEIDPLDFTLYMDHVRPFKLLRFVSSPEKMCSLGTADRPDEFSLGTRAATIR